MQENPQNEFSVKGGEAFISFDRARLQLKALADTVIYKASVPLIRE
jgi:hypothetical protein